MKHTFAETLQQPLIFKLSTLPLLRASIDGLYIEDIHIFGMNMTFISSSEAKKLYFMSGEATNEIYIFSLHEMK